MDSEEGDNESSEQRESIGSISCVKSLEKNERCDYGA